MNTALPQKRSAASTGETYSGTVFSASRVISLAVRFARLLRSFNVDEAAANEAFRRLDLDGDGYLTHDEISRSVEEFFYSDDPQASGDWLVGPI